MGDAPGTQIMALEFSVDLKYWDWCNSLDNGLW